ncbi:hypothetical protein [Ammoniphilus sp. CFH 90114]|uniref:hypothetical protein n=1 Tax=Ammoniphilus sp. CFH 90114 TaxID=2493665 RepID=UPI00100F7813|nr:hypothetical protein [Ammoniphilus sp. CFH 90114]RXT06562.1 hypothetical protein EIZ39_16000 [Ammoniphilus sp. CFH 90114]
MKRYISLLLMLLLLGNVATAQGNEQGTEIFKVSIDGKKKETVAKFSEMYHPHISPKGNYFYMEKMQHQSEVPVSYSLYHLKTKKWMSLAQEASWYPLSEVIAYIKQNQIVSLLPETEKEITIYSAPEGKVVDSFLIAPNEKYMTILQLNKKTNNHELVLLDMKTLKHRVNDQFKPSATEGEKMRWLPNGNKVFYKTSTSMKELDLPSGLKYVHKLKELPDYSADLHFRLEQEGPFNSSILNVKTGKKNQFGSGTSERFLEQLYWAPTGHTFVGSIQGPTSNAQDAYQSFVYSDGKNTMELPGLFRFLKTIDNIRFSGWSTDQKWVYFADLESIHFFRYMN